MYLNNNSFFLCLLIYIKVKCEIAIKGFYNQGLGTVYIKGGLGTPLQDIYFTVDINLDINYVYSLDSNYDSSNSITFKKNNNYIKYSPKIEGYEAYEMLSFHPDHYLTNWKFIFTQTSDNNTYTPFLGFGIGNESFINQLFIAGIIKQKTFCFNYSHIIIDKEIEQSQELTKLKIIDNSKYFGYVNEVFFGKYSEEKETRTIIVPKDYNKVEFSGVKFLFSSTKGNIHLPMKYFEIFKKLYFGEFLWKECVEFQYYKGLNIQCNKKMIKNLPNVYLILESNILLQFSYLDLFEETVPYAPKLTFRISFENELDDAVFGLSFLKAFNIIFDQGKKEIIFPKSNKIHTLVITNIYFFSLFIIMITNSCLLLFGFIIQLFCYINKNTKLIE